MAEVENPNAELPNEPTEKSAAEASDLRNEATEQRNAEVSDLRNEPTQTSGLAGTTGAAKKMDPDARLKELYRQLSEFGKRQFEDFDSPGTRRRTPESSERGDRAWLAGWCGLTSADVG